MANVIRHKRGTSDPAASDFSQTAELLVNTNEGRVFTKTDDGDVVQVGGDFVASNDIDSWVFKSELSVADQENNPKAIDFKSDGTKMFVTGPTGDDVNEYNLSTAWDITTATYSQKFAVGGDGATAPQGMQFKPDGTKFFIACSNTDRIYEYNLSTAWDVSTASYVQRISVSAQDTVPVGVAFKSDGTKMFVVGYTNDSVYEYHLSTAWDISTASYDSLFDLDNPNNAFPSQDDLTIPEDLDFSSDGTSMYVVGRSYDKVHRYTLSTAWDVSTATLAERLAIRLPLDTYFSNATGIAVEPSGNRAYLIGHSTDKVFELETDKPATKFDGTRFVAENDVHLKSDVLVYKNLAVQDELFVRQNVYVDSTLTVRGAIDLADSDHLRFGNSDDWRLFYDGTNNIANLEMESACLQFDITDNGTNRLTITKSTGVVALTATPTVSGNSVWHAGNDGSGSGLDADTVDGVQASSFIRSDTQDSITGPIEFTDGTLQTYDPTSGSSGSDTATDVAIALGSGHRIVGHSGGYIRSLFEWDYAGDITIGQGSTSLIAGINFISGNSATNVKVNGNRILTVADEGSGNGIDADTVDGIEASAFYQADTALSATTGTFSGDVTMSGTGALKVANGTTAQRPTASNGQIRYNTTLGALESYVSGAWQVIANTALDYGLITSASDTTFDYGALS